MVIACLLALLATVGGTLLTYGYDARATLGARVSTGFPLGTTLAGFAGYIAASRWGLNPATLVLATLFALLPVALLLRPPVRALVIADLRDAVRPPRPRRRRLWLWAGWLATVALLVAVFRGTLYVEDSGDWINCHHNLGDLPFHLALVQGFAIGDNYPPQHPEFAGARLTYPFLVDFVAAQSVRAGASLPHALLLQNIGLALSLVGLLHRWAFRWTRRVGAAVLTPFLIFLSGGAGFWLLRGDLQSHSFLDTLRSLPRDYTIGADLHLRWGNCLTTLLTTQRGLLMAFPLAVVVWTIWHGRALPRPGAMTRLLAAGGITGLLPLVHGHTFLALCLVAGAIALSDLWQARRQPRLRLRLIQAWAGYFALALVVSLPQVWLLAQSSSVKGGSFVGWQPGWDGDGMPLFPFWLWNLGAFIPLLLFALPAGRKYGASPRLARLYAPFLLCFLLPNLVRLAPWVWDNIKVLFYWHAASAAVVAVVLTQLWGRRRGRWHPLRRVGAALLLVTLTLAGSLDTLRIGRGDLRQELFTADGIAFAREVARVTDPHDVILHAPQYNHPALLSGRRFVMGYEGHLWSHGLDFAQRKADVWAIYGGDPQTPALLRRHQIAFIIIGPNERTFGDGLTVSDAYWSAYPVAARVGPYLLLRVR